MYQELKRHQIRKEQLKREKKALEEKEEMQAQEMQLLQQQLQHYEAQAAGYEAQAAGLQAQEGKRAKQDVTQPHAAGAVVSGIWPTHPLPLGRIDKNSPYFSRPPARRPGPQADPSNPHQQAPPSFPAQAHMGLQPAPSFPAQMEYPAPNAQHNPPNAQNEHQQAPHLPAQADLGYQPVPLPNAQNEQHPPTQMGNQQPAPNTQHQQGAPHDATKVAMQDNLASHVAQQGDVAGGGGGFLTDNFAKDLGIGDLMELSDQEDEAPGEKPLNTGELASLYDELCELEIKQGKSNPGVKSVYGAVSQKIRDCATRFSNQQANCRTHFKKQPAKSRSAAKKAAAKPVKPADSKEEDDAE
eukprot:s2475_g8.t1